MRTTISRNVAALCSSLTYINCRHQLRHATKTLLIFVAALAFIIEPINSTAQEEVVGVYPPEKYKYTKPQEIQNKTAGNSASVTEPPNYETQEELLIKWGLPEEIVKLRQIQSEVARNSNISVFQQDLGRRSVSGINGVPRELRAVPILNEQDMEAAISALYPYFAFTGTESLRLEREGSPGMEGTTTDYLFREYINEIETPLLVSISVDDRTRRVARIQGNVHIDRELDRTPRQSEKEAIELVLRYIEQSPQRNSNNYLIDGEHYGQVIYKPWGFEGLLTPFWKVEIERANPNLGLTHQTFVVDPDDDVRVDGISRRAASSAAN